VQISTRSSFDQYRISHKTISHWAAAAPDSEVRREYPMTKLTALPILATNPGDATGYRSYEFCTAFSSVCYLPLASTHTVDDAAATGRNFGQNSNNCHQASCSTIKS